MAEDNPSDQSPVEQPEVATGLSSLDPTKVDATLSELVKFDHELRDHGMSLCDTLTDLVKRSMGIFLDPPAQPEES